MRLDAIHVPGPLRHLVPLAERWGIGDDGYRAEAIRGASSADLEELVRAFDDVTFDDLDWLTGDEAKDPAREDEVQALICLEMALHQAVVEQQRRRERGA